MGDRCISTLPSKSACTSSFHSAKSEDRWRKPWRSQRHAIQQLQKKQKQEDAFFLKASGSKALMMDIERKSRRSRIPKTLLVHSSFLDHISPLVHQASSDLGPAMSTFHQFPSLLQQFSPISTLLISSLATQVMHDSQAMFNHITTQITHGTLQGWMDQRIHGLSILASEDTAHIASSSSISSPSTAATIFMALTGSSIASKPSKRHSSSSLSKLKTLKAARLSESQIKQSTGSKEPAGERKCQNHKDAEDSLPLQFDAEVISDYFKKRPFLVFSRASFILFECSNLLINIMLDTALGKAEQNEKLRASQLVNLLTLLGPTAIKVGQALSVRPDLLSPLYLEELQKLQDSVPPFSSEEAQTMIFEGLGRAVNEVYSEFSEQPIAAASLGQVYKARLRESGETVAVKVQRPDVLGRVCLDLYIVRNIAKGLQRLPGHNSSDLLSFIDHWADHFFQELDYIQEAKNTEKFSKNMQSLSGVVIPKAITQYTSSKVLTTSWVEGEKLSESTDADVPQLVSVALNCYLMQLLESGFLHADPHPGNLLRTPDGRLCVLDYGLMIQVTEDQRYALIDYICHLVNSDFERVADDLIKLGFVPSHLVNDELATEILPQLSRVLSQLVKGGGLQQVDVNQLIADLAQMATEHSIVIPPYFAMILRAFSILEGIGLKTNPNYVIIDECYPYICKRLLTDDSPRARSALKYFLYGKKSQLDARRVEALLFGIQNFRKTMTTTNGIGKLQPMIHQIDSTSQQVLDSLLAPEGSFLQELILAELVRVVDALSREATFELWNTFVGITLPLSRLIPLPFSVPLSTAFFGASPMYSLSEEDQEALSLARRLAGLLGSEMNKQTDTGMTRTTAAHSVMALFPEMATGMATASTRFWLMLLHRKALRFADDLDGRNSLVSWNMDPAASARHVRPLAFFPPPQLPEFIEN